MLKSANRVLLHLAQQAAQSTPGAKIRAVHTEYADEGLVDVWVEVPNEFVGWQFDGNYQRFLYGQSRSRSSHNGNQSQDRFNPQ